MKLGIMSRAVRSVRHTDTVVSQAKSCYSSSSNFFHIASHIDRPAYIFCTFASSLRWTSVFSIKPHCTEYQILCS